MTKMKITGSLLLLAAATTFTASTAFAAEPAAAAGQRADAVESALKSAGTVLTDQSAKAGAKSALRTDENGDRYFVTANGERVYIIMTDTATDPGIILTFVQ